MKVVIRGAHVRLWIYKCVPHDQILFDHLLNDFLNNFVRLASRQAVNVACYVDRRVSDPG